MNIAPHLTSPSPLRMPPALRVSLGAVVLVHAALVARQWEGAATGRAASVASATHVRMVTVQVDAPVPVDDSAIRLGPMQLDATQPLQFAAWGLGSLLDPRSEAAPAAPPAAAPETLPPAQAEATLARDPDEDLYVPRSRLSVPPVAREQIRVDFPASFQERGDYTVVLSLFIDEAGYVRRVRVDSVGVPPELQDAASLAFLHARYSPGQVDGQPVKSLIRIAVGFEDDRA